MEEDGCGASDVKLGRRNRIIDHEAEHRLSGLVSVIGVRFTVSRQVAADTVDLVFRRLGKKPPICSTDVTPLIGGAIENFTDFMQQEMAKLPPALTEAVMERLLRNYGTLYREVVESSPEQRSFETLNSSSVLKAEVVHAVRNEMALRLADVVLRRTDLGTAGHPGEAALRDCAAIMAQELSWSQDRTAAELADVVGVYP